jgi:hypothetical protein
MRHGINSGSSDGMPPVDKSKFEQRLLAGGYCSSSFSLGFLLEQARRKSNILLSNLIQNTVANLQKAVPVADSTFLLCRARAEILRERREALYTPVCIIISAKDETYSKTVC